MEAIASEALGDAVAIMDLRAVLDAITLQLRVHSLVAREQGVPRLEISCFGCCTRGLQISIENALCGPLPP